MVGTFSSPFSRLNYVFRCNIMLGAKKAMASLWHLWFLSDCNSGVQCNFLSIARYMGGYKLLNYFYRMAATRNFLLYHMPVVGGYSITQQQALTFSAAYIL